MVRDADILITNISCRLSEFGDVTITVRGVCVDVEVAFDVFKFNQLRQCVGLCGVNFSTVFAKQRVDVIKTELLINFFLNRTCNHFVGLEQAVLI